MAIQINAQSRIEDPRNYGPDIVSELRGLLMAGKCAHRDPRRLHLYELEAGQSTFYIHISPVSGDIMLLARWQMSSAVNGLDATASENNPEEILTAICD